MTERESLAVIQQMIFAAKVEQKDDGKGWIVWGWLIFAASVFTILNIKFDWHSSTFFFWNVFGIITLIFLFIQTARYLFGKKTTRVNTYTKDLFDKLNTGFFLTLMLIIISINVGVPPTKGFALLLGLYGFWILIYGAVLNFRPSIIGAYITWIFAFASLFAPDFMWTMILHAAAVLAGYIIPGHLANVEFNKLNKEAIKQGV